MIFLVRSTSKSHTSEGSEFVYPIIKTYSRDDTMKLRFLASTILAVIFPIASAVNEPRTYNLRRVHERALDEYTTDDPTDAPTEEEVPTTAPTPVLTSLTALPTKEFERERNFDISPTRKLPTNSPTEVGTSITTSVFTTGDPTGDPTDAPTEEEVPTIAPTPVLTSSTALPTKEFERERIFDISPTRELPTASPTEGGTSITTSATTTSTKTPSQSTPSPTTSFPTNNPTEPPSESTPPPTTPFPTSAPTEAPSESTPPPTTPFPTGTPTNKKFIGIKKKKRIDKKNVKKKRTKHSRKISSIIRSFKSIFSGDD